MTSRLTLAFLVLLLGIPGGLTASSSAAAAPQESATPGLETRIDKLGDLDYAERTNAARAVRRGAAPTVVPMLTEAVRNHRDEYVRFRALILLTGFNDPATPDLMRALLKDRNDRLREVAYGWFADNPNRAMTPTLLAALETEQAEFVRPALIRAVAALDADPLAQRALLAEAGRGLDFFRSAVIEALGDRRAAYAADAIAAIARNDGPLQDDAVIALAKIGGSGAAAVIAAPEKPSAEAALAAHAALCLMGDACATHLAALDEAARRRGNNAEASRAAFAALGAVAARGNADATVALLELGGAADPRIRDQAAVGFATVALRNANHMLIVLTALPDERQAVAIALLQDGFEALEDDVAEERFFVATRAAYWKAPEDSPARTLMASLIQTLEF